MLHTGNEDPHLNYSPHSTCTSLEDHLNFRFLALSSALPSKVEVIAPVTKERGLLGGVILATRPLTRVDSFGRQKRAGVPPVELRLLVLYLAVLGVHIPTSSSTRTRLL